MWAYEELLQWVWGECGFDVQNTCGCGAGVGTLLLVCSSPLHLFFHPFPIYSCLLHLFLHPFPPCSSLRLLFLHPSPLYSSSYPLISPYTFLHFCLRFIFSLIHSSISTYRFPNYFILAKIRFVLVKSDDVLVRSAFVLVRTDFVSFKSYICLSWLKLFCLA